jgi:carbon storage regulator CsrA
MLILSRREGESIVIPDCRVQILVKEIGAGMVRLGFKAPDEVDIYRTRFGGICVLRIGTPLGGQEMALNIIRGIQKPRQSVGGVRD